IKVHYKNKSAIANSLNWSLVATEVLRSLVCHLFYKLDNPYKQLNQDDELPDYIMILVGNGKTKDQMDDDLSLFLGHNTERFTSWLHEVLQRLNAASILQKENKVGKEKKKEEEKEKEKTSSDAEEPKVPKVVEEKKKHKKKKDKSEKKKEKKEKKKKKDKEKHSKSQKHKGKETSKSKSRSPILLKSEEASNEAEAESVLESTSTSKKNIEPESLGSVYGIKSNEESEVASHSAKDEEIPSDVVNLRPNAEDLALGLEDEPPSKKIKITKSVIKEIKEKDQKVSSSPEHKIISTVTNIEIKVDNTRAKESNLSATSDDEVSSTGIHERLGPKRVINLREESSFPPKSSGTEEGMGRVISSAIASAVKSVSSDVKPSKRLEARVRPLVSSRIKEPEEEVDDVALPPARLVSTVGADDSDNDEEPPTKRVVGIASKVEVTPRPRRTGAQANTALILRAVADAHKSVNKPSKKILEDKDEGKMVKKEIFTRSYQERQSHRLGGSSEGKTLKKFAITVPNSLLKENVNMKIAEKPVLDSSYVDEVEMEGSCDVDSEMEHTETRLKSKIMPQVKTLSTSKVLPMQVDETSGSTRFIVTLDGFGNEVTSSDLRSKLRGRPVSGVPSVDDEQEIIEEVEEWEEEVEEMELGTPQSYQRKKSDVDIGQHVKKGQLVFSFIHLRSAIPFLTVDSVKNQICRYGKKCQTTSCLFVHPDVTTGSLLKWTAPKQTAKPAGGSPIKLSTTTEASPVTSSNV
ncbi:Zinc finger CCCH domain-containing protein 14, partial [Armadillidium vulgare]